MFTVFRIFFISLVVSLFISLVIGSEKTMALTYEDAASVCSEVTIQDKITRNCSGRAEFKDVGNGKHSLNVWFKVGDFEIQDIEAKKRYDKNLKANEEKEIVFRSPEFTSSEWSENLKSIFRLLDAVLIVGEEKIKVTDSLLVKKTLGGKVSYQVDAIVPTDKAPFIKLPPGLRGARTIHLTLLVPESEIKGTKF